MLSVAIGIAMVSGTALVAAAPAEAITSSAKTSFISKIVGAAQSAQRKFGVPTSVSIAQAIVASDWGTSAAADDANNYFDTPCSAAMTASQFAKLAEAQVGKPYVLGAEASLANADPAKFDCSELVEWLFGRSGNPITDLAASQYNVTKAVAKGTSPKVGDLVFLRNNPARSNGIGHVAVLTKKLASGDWQIIEARGRAYGVVKTTLSYWKSRSYYAGLRRYAKLVFADGDGVTSSAANLYQSGCTTISSTRYAKFSSITNSFYGHAAAVTSDSAYKTARTVITNIPKFVDAIAKVERPKDAADYAATIKSLIDTYNLTDYEVVPFTIVLDSGDKGPKVTALQNLLLARGSSVKPTGTYDSTTVSAVRKFQSAKKLTVDGEAGPKTLTALFPTLESGATGTNVVALHNLLTGLGFPATGSTFGKETLAAVKDFQVTAGRSGSGVVDATTWSMLYMTPGAAPAPTVAGTAKVTQTLTATPGKWSPTSVSLAHQWYRDGKAIEDATGLSYTLQPADAGARITFSTTGTKAGYTTVMRYSAATAAVAKASLTATPTPKITGTPTVGGTLTAVGGTWAPAPVELAYQWYRGSTQIPGATNAGYVLQGADAGEKIKVAVTGTSPGFETVTRTSAAIGAVAKGSLSATPTPKITGKTVVGETLTAVPGTWSPEPVELAYQWYRGSTAIPDAKDSSYVLTDADADAALKVRVTGTKAGYNPVSKTSAATETVEQPGVLTTATPKISGTARVGKTLKVTAGDWGPGTVKLTYRWYHASRAISGATGTSYKVKSVDKAHTIWVKVTGSKAGYNSASERSSRVMIK
ncbi:MAG: peptidoglycan-binding protein [Propionibacteriaceae bacterium]|nr:peptidoglycan-binding protein [Propionibacteriaceae bacterium]